MYQNTVTTKRNANFLMIFFWGGGVKRIDFQNDSISVALSFDKDLLNRVSSKI